MTLVIVIVLIAVVTALAALDRHPRREEMDDAHLRALARVADQRKR